LLEIKPVDTEFYENYIKDFLPNKIIDIHTHIWLDKFKTKEITEPSRMVTWPDLVAKDNSIEELIETYRLMFPDNKVTPLVFSNLNLGDDFDGANEYVQACSQKHGFPLDICCSTMELCRIRREDSKRQIFRV
jgi:uncharacterized protein